MCFPIFCFDVCFPGLCYVFGFSFFFQFDVSMFVFLCMVCFLFWSMFCLFFSEGPIYNLETATAAAKTGEFPEFFHKCLSGGLYLAPSPYETGFISMAHSGDDITKTVEIIKKAMT